MFRDRPTLVFVVTYLFLVRSYQEEPQEAWLCYAFLPPMFDIPSAFDYTPYSERSFFSVDIAFPAFLTFIASTINNRLRQKIYKKLMSIRIGGASFISIKRMLTCGHLSILTLFNGPQRHLKYTT